MGLFRKVLITEKLLGKLQFQIVNWDQGIYLHLYDQMLFWDLILMRLLWMVLLMFDRKNTMVHNYVVLCWLVVCVVFVSDMDYNSIIHSPCSIRDIFSRLNSRTFAFVAKQNKKMKKIQSIIFVFNILIEWKLKLEVFVFFLKTFRAVSKFYGKRKLFIFLKNKAIDPPLLFTAVTF